MKSEQNKDLSWTVQHIEGEYWWFGDSGIPHGPYSDYYTASDDLAEYTNDWELID